MPADVRVSPNTAGPPSILEACAERIVKGCRHSDGDLKALLARNNAYFEWCLRLARLRLAKGQPEQAAQWCAVAAFLGAEPGWFGVLADADLEEILLRISATLPRVAPSTRATPPRRWLHVMTEAWHWGGMIENLKRWMRFTGAHAINHVVLLDQRNQEGLTGLRRLMEGTPGELTVLDRSCSLLGKAAALRSLAAEKADIVVLHTWVAEVVPVLAFGVAGGPPVLRMNADDHMFWVGASVADLVINFRELGERWTKTNRGVDRSAFLPLPLDAPRPELLDVSPRSRRNAARARFGIPDDGVALLTVGSDYKFRPVGEWDFLNAAEAILTRCPRAIILAVGVTLEGRWRTLGEAFHGRLKALGVQTDMSDCHASCDIGLGSIPFPSQTAILEIGLLGKPCVLTPMDVPIGINDIAFEGMSRPKTTSDYVDMAVQLVNNPTKRREEGTRLANSIENYHCQRGWIGYWQSLQNRTPAEHQVFPLHRCSPMRTDECSFWAEFARLPDQDVLHHIHFNIICQGRGIWPRSDAKLMSSLKSGAVAGALFEVRFLLRKLRYQMGALARPLKTGPVAKAAQSKVSTCGRRRTIR
jgi:hypothetical protein